MKKAVIGLIVAAALAAGAGGAYLVVKALPEARVIASTGDDAQRQTIPDHDDERPFGPQGRDGNPYGNHPGTPAAVEWPRA